LNYIINSFRHADVVVREPEFITQYNEILSVLDNISDEDIIKEHEGIGADDITRIPKSISVAINHLIKQRITALGWHQESPIFQDTLYSDNRWRLDFAKGEFSVEVGFNHSGSVAWNLIKPVLASELNHVKKAIQTRVAVIITATQDMRIAGGFDGAIGTFEIYKSYLTPLRNILTVPMIIIGLTAPKSFKIVHSQPVPRKTIGKVVYL